MLKKEQFFFRPSKAGADRVLVEKTFCPVFTDCFNLNSGYVKKQTFYLMKWL